MNKFRLFIIDDNTGKPRENISVLARIVKQNDLPVNIMLGLYQSDHVGYLSFEVPLEYLKVKESPQTTELIEVLKKSIKRYLEIGDRANLEIKINEIIISGFRGYFADLKARLELDEDDNNRLSNISIIFVPFNEKKDFTDIDIEIAAVAANNAIQLFNITYNVNPQINIFKIQASVSANNGNTYPSYAPNPDQLDRTISPNSFSTQPKLLIGQGECEELLPNPLAEQLFKFTEILIHSKIIKFIYSDIDSLFEADIRLGASIEIKTEWFPLGHALGEIKYSLALAPAEEVKIAVIDWERKDTATRTEGVEYTEELKNEQLRERSISDTMKAALKERQNSDSFSIGASASGGFGGVSASVSTAASWTNSQASRDTSASSMQALADSVSQASSNIRNMYSTVVVQVTQKEEEKVETRTVKNHNHAHALTILYYEILRQYRVKITPMFKKGLLFLKMKGLENVFTDDLILSNYNIIKNNLLDPSFSSSLDLFQQINSGEVEKIKLLVGETDLLPKKNTKISFIRIRIASDTIHANFNIIVLLKFTSSDIWFSYNMGNGKLEEFFSPYATTGNLYSLSDNEFRPYYSTFNKPSFGLDIHELSGVGLYYKPAAAPSAELNLTGVTIEYTSNNNGTEWEKIYDTADYGNQGFPQSLVIPYIAGSADLPKYQMWIKTLPIFVPAASPLAQQNNNIADSLNVFQNKAISNIKEHINNNKSYYWRKILLNRENNIYASEFDKITLINNPTETLLDIATPIPINVIGDYLVFEIPDEENHYISDLKEIVKRNLKEDIKYTDVSLPTRGVFAETKLSHCSAAEVIDETRFWKWHEAPDNVDAPDIAAINTGTRNQQTNLTPSQMPNSNLTIINPAPAPDPGTGIAGGLSLLGSLGAFTQSQGDQQTVRAAMQGNLDNVRRIAELNTQLELQRRAQQNIDQTSDRIQRAVESRRLTPEQGQRMQEQLHSNLVGGDASSNETDSQPDVMDTIMNNAANNAMSTGSNFEASDGHRKISVGESKQAAALAPVYNYVPVDWHLRTIDDRILYIMELFVDAGYSINGAAGIVGNLLVETKLSLLPNMVQDATAIAPMTVGGHLLTAIQVMNKTHPPHFPHGIGLAQWTAEPRRRGLFAYSHNGVVLAENILFNTDAQIGYIDTELSGNVGLYNALRGAISINNASDRVLREYEIPGVIVNEATNPAAALTRVNKSRTQSRRAARIYNTNHPPEE